MLSLHSFIATLKKVTEWPSDQVTEGPSDRVTKWPSDRVTKWPSDWVTEWLNDMMTGSFADDWPYGIFNIYMQFFMVRHALFFDKGNDLIITLVKTVLPLISSWSVLALFWTLWNVLCSSSSTHVTPPILAAGCWRCCCSSNIILGWRLPSSLGCTPASTPRYSRLVITPHGARPDIGCHTAMWLLRGTQGRLKCIMFITSEPFFPCSLSYSVLDWPWPVP